MNHNTRNDPYLTVGLDLSDWTTQICNLDAVGEAPDRGDAAFGADHGRPGRCRLVHAEDSRTAGQRDCLCFAIELPVGDYEAFVGEDPGAATAGAAGYYGFASFRVDPSTTQLEIDMRRGVTVRGQFVGPEERLRELLVLGFDVVEAVERS